MKVSWLKSLAAIRDRCQEENNSSRGGTWNHESVFAIREIFVLNLRPITYLKLLQLSGG